MPFTIPRVRWHYRDPLLVWLFPVAYGCHLLEEWFGGFPEWVALIGGRPLPRPAFLLINGVAAVVLVAATRATTRHERHGWMGIAIATVVVLNALLHLLGSILTARYSPGLFTGVVLYAPLGQLALMRAWQQAEHPLFTRGVVTGIAAHALVLIAAYVASA